MMGPFKKSWLVLAITLALLANLGECKNRRNRGKDPSVNDMSTGNEITSDIFDEGVGDTDGDSISSDESLMKGGREGWDPSFLDILSSDYFDESPKEKKTQSIKIGDDEDAIPAMAASEENAEDPMGVPVPPGVEEEEAVTSRAPCSGCAREVDTEDPKIQDIASFAFKNHLNSLEDSELGRHLVRVVKAQTQVVAGQKYSVDLELGYSNCSKGELTSQEEETASKCFIDPEKETFICNFEVLEQKWINHTELLLTKCDQIQEEAAEADTDQMRDPEEAEARIGEMDSDELEEVLKEITTPTATTTVTSAAASESKEDKQRRKRRKRDTYSVTSDPNKSIGGLRDADEDKKTLMELANYAVEQLDTIDEDNDARLVMDILSAKKQTVSGWLYHLKIRVAQTTCEEGSEVTYEKCKDKISLPYSVCNIKVLFQPWQTVQKKVTESQCSQEKMKKGKKLGKQFYFKKDGSSKPSGNEVLNDKQLLGGFSPVDPDSAEMAKLTDFVMTSVDAQSNAMHAQKLVRVIEAQRQVVSGVKTKMVIEIGYTQCRKSRQLEREKCEFDDSREHNFCKVTVWEQPWMKTRKVTESKCGKKDELYRKKRSALPEAQPYAYPSTVARSITTTSRGSGVVISTHQKNNLDLEEKKFGIFMAQHGKKYDSDEEYQYRLGVFKQNLQKIKLLQEYEEGTATYGVTRFADLTEEEFSGHSLGLRPDLKRKFKSVKQANIPNLPKLPDEFDWRNYNAVTPVKNQGLCGSCWAFSVTGNIEGLYAVKHKSLVSFSEQG